MSGQAQPDRILQKYQLNGGRCPPTKSSLLDSVLHIDHTSFRLQNYWLLAGKQMMSDLFTLCASGARPRNVRYNLHHLWPNSLNRHKSLQWQKIAE